MFIRVQRVGMIMICINKICSVHVLDIVRLFFVLFTISYILIGLFTERHLSKSKHYESVQTRKLVENSFVAFHSFTELEIIVCK